MVANSRQAAGGSMLTAIADDEDGGDNRLCFGTEAFLAESVKEKPKLIMACFCAPNTTRTGSRRQLFEPSF